ncbi:hypothetical protein B0H19DRAFT_1180544 [Mycena capillaripes]|nr:hypothetical protein B0H19DRAFT_1180544 [Mycena capillaripes]
MFNKLLSAAAFAALLLTQGAISAPQVSSPGSHKPCMFVACISSLHRSLKSPGSHRHHHGRVYAGPFCTTRAS